MTLRKGGNMVLSNRSIIKRLDEEDPKKKLVIKNFNRELQVGVASISLRLSAIGDCYDFVYQALNERSGVQISTDRLYNILTEEEIEMPADLVGKLVTKSTFARNGLMVHAASDMIDPGFKGRIQLEVSVVGSPYLRICPLLPVAELYFYQLDSEADLSGHKRKFNDQENIVIPDISDPKKMIIKS